MYTKLSNFYKKRKKRESKQMINKLIANIKKTNAPIVVGIRLRSRTDIASFDIANDNETLFLAVGNGLLIRTRPAASSRTASSTDVRCMSGSASRLPRGARAHG